MIQKCAGQGALQLVVMVGCLQWLLSSHVAPFVVCVPVIVLLSEGEI